MSGDDVFVPKCGQKLNALGRVLGNWQLQGKSCRSCQEFETEFFFLVPSLCWRFSERMEFGEMGGGGRGFKDQAGGKNGRNQKKQIILRYPSPRKANTVCISLYVDSTY